jgi:hypothetical protein
MFYTVMGYHLNADEDEYNNSMDLDECVNTSGNAGSQILHLPLGDDSSPLGDSAVSR